MNWKLIIGNTLFSTGSATMTMMSGNGMHIIDIGPEDISRVSLMMGGLYFVIAVGRELTKEGEKIESNENSKSILRRKRKEYHIENTAGNSKSNIGRILDCILPI